MPETAGAPALSRRVRTLKPSATVAMGAKARQLKGEGKDVISFALGEPDFDTPKRIKDAAIKALNEGQTHYTATLGPPAAREAIAAKLRDENGIPDLGAEHIAISAGAKHALFTICHCLFDPPGAGEEAGEAIIPVPAWVSYAPIVELAGGRIVEVPTTPESDFKATAEQIRDAITERTRLLILNSPSNPCGTMYSEAELREIAAVVAEAAQNVAPQMVILSDEIYEKIIYGGIPHFSIGSVPEVSERTITLNGMSKAFAMTGWRVGYAACPGAFGAGLIKAMGALQGQMTTNITSFIYPAIPVALTQCADEVEAMRQAFAKRAELTERLLNQIPGVQAPKPTGAFYMFPRVSDHFGKVTPGGRAIGSALDFAESLLGERLVAVTPGEDFGGHGDEHVRISFACSEAQIEAGIARIAAFVADLR
ncbi:MAG: pyridoxal phosphate-dependent aminotransferase [Phycisphaerales bacterium]